MLRDNRVKYAMKVQLFLRLLLAFFFSAVLVRADNLKWDRQEILEQASLGQEKVTGIFGFTNVGTSPVRIESLESTCECTTATATKSVVGPGESAQVIAVFSLGTSVGRQTKSIVVRTDTTTERVVLWLTADIPALASVTPAKLEWRASQQEERAILVTSNVDEPIQIFLGKLPAQTFTSKVESSADGKSHTIRLKPEKDHRARRIILLFEVRRGKMAQSYSVTALLN